MSRHRVAMATAGFALSLTLGRAQAPPPKPPPFTPAQQAAEHAFHDGVAAYEKVVQNASAGLPAARPTDVPAATEARRRQLVERINQLRVGARPGDLFPPEVAALIRQRIQLVLSGPEGHAVRVSLSHSEPADQFPLRVGSAFPDAYVPLQSAPASLLLYLPSLPEGLEYRIVGASLVLRDRASNQVVDWVPNAIPPA